MWREARTWADSMDIIHSSSSREPPVTRPDGVTYLVNRDLTLAAAAAEEDHHHRINLSGGGGGGGGSSSDETGWTTTTATGGGGGGRRIADRGSGGSGTSAQSSRTSPASRYIIQQQESHNYISHQPPPRGQPRYMNYSGSGGGEGRVPDRFRDERDGSEIVVLDSAYHNNNNNGHHGGGRVHLGSRAPPSLFSDVSGRSGASSVKTKTSRKGGVVIETMSAPNPLCPNTRGACCLLLLLNLGLILITLGFSIVLQLFDPPFVWYCGIAFLIVGFIALIASLLFCVHLCRESRANRAEAGLDPGELYWTHHWQKRISLPGMTSREKSQEIQSPYSLPPSRAGSHQPITIEDEHHHPDKYVVIGRERNPRDKDNMSPPLHSYRHHH